MISKCFLGIIRKIVIFFIISRPRDKTFSTYSFSSNNNLVSEEIHQVNCELNILLVEHGDFISEGFELIPGLFQNFRTYYYPSKK
jgi:hypothetical protein